MADRLSVRSTRELPCYMLKKDWWRRERACAGHKRVWATPAKPRFQGETVGFLIRPEDSEGQEAVE